MVSYYYTYMCIKNNVGKAILLLCRILQLIQQQEPLYFQQIWQLCKAVNEWARLQPISSLWLFSFISFIQHSNLNILPINSIQILLPKSLKKFFISWYYFLQFLMFDSQPHGTGLGDCWNDLKKQSFLMPVVLKKVWEGFKLFKTF